MKLSQISKQTSSLMLLQILLSVMALVPRAMSQSSSPLGYYRLLEVKPGTVATMLVALANTSRYMMIERIRGEAFVNAATVVDLQKNQSRSFRPTFEHFCAGVAITNSGDVLLMGGHPTIRGMQTGLPLISLFNRISETFTLLSRMTRPRWYPTPVRIDDTRILIVGGTNESDKGEPAPHAEVWSSSIPTVFPRLFPSQPETFVAAAGKNWYPFMALLPRGHLLWWGDIGGSITDLNGNLIVDLPPLPAGLERYRTMYPYTATPTMLAYDPATGYKPTLVIFGGTAVNATPTTNASSLVLRLDLDFCASGSSTYCPRGWELDDMLGIRRVLGDSVLLPNGRVMVVNGGQAGNGRYSKMVSADLDPTRTTYNGRTNYPVTVALEYDPVAPLGQRFQKLAPTNIVRMYHSVACLHHTGEVLIAGCDTCGVGFLGAPADWSPSPDGALEKRLQLVVPPELASGLRRPGIVRTPTSIFRGQNFTVQYNGTTVVRASLASPCAVTHSINMNQRVVFLRVVSSTPSSTVLQAPPANMPSLAPAGWYILFLLSPDGVYSQGAWVKLA